MQKPPGNDPRRLMWSRRPISHLTLAGERDWEPNKEPAQGAGTAVVIPPDP